MAVPAGEAYNQAVHSLLDWVREHNDWPVDSPFEQVVRATFAQSTKTFGAIVQLLDAGYGTDALRLSRSLFETVVVGYWMTYVADPEWVLKRLAEHRDYISVKWVDTLADLPDWEQPDEETRSRFTLNETQRERLVAIYGAYAENAWWSVEAEQRPNGKWRRTATRNLRSLVDDLLQIEALEGRLWESSEGEHTPTPMLRMMLDVPQRMNNQLLHHNPSGLAAYVSKPRDTLVYDDGPSNTWVEPASVFAYTSYLLLTQLMITRYRPELEPAFDKALKPIASAAWAQLDDDGLRFARDPANRNASCPCGSGLKCKRCHGRSA